MTKHLVNQAHCTHVYTHKYTPLSTHTHLLQTYMCTSHITSFSLKHHKVEWSGALCASNLFRKFHFRKWRNVVHMHTYVHTYLYTYAIYIEAVATGTLTWKWSRSGVLNHKWRYNWRLCALCFYLSTLGWHGQYFFFNFKNF